MKKKLIVLLLSGLMILEPCNFVVAEDFTDGENSAIEGVTSLESENDSIQNNDFYVGNQDLTSNEVTQGETEIQFVEDKDDSAIKDQIIEDVESEENKSPNINKENSLNERKNTSEEIFSDEISSEEHGNIIANGIERNDITWNLYEDGTLVVEGSNKLSYTTELQNYKDKIKTIIIGKDITSLDTHIFHEFNNLRKVVLNDKIKTIDDWAFEGCVNLTDINIPKNLKKIGTGAFRDCKSLVECNIPETVSDIGEQAFSGCSSLKNVTIPSSISKIEISTFYGCTSLENIDIPANTTDIGSSAFKNCSNLKKINFSDGLMSIGISAFYGCGSLEKIVFPDSLRKIYAYAFEDCEKIESIVLPAEITDIDSLAFGFINIKYIFYKGTQEQWNEKKDKWGFVFYNAIVHYNASDHIWNTQPTIDEKPTCAKNGVESIHCSVCNVVKSDSSKIIPMTDIHKYVFSKHLNLATVFEKQKDEYVCSVCHKIEIRSIGNTLQPTIKINVNKINLKINQKITNIKASNWAAGDKIVSWKSSNNNIVKVQGYSNGKCIITAGKKVGNANITIQLKSGYTKQLPVTVQKGDVETIKIIGVKKSQTLYKGEKITLTPTLSPIYSSQKIAYISSNPKVATVNSKGIIKACGVGTATITVKSGKKAAICKIRVIYQSPNFDAYLAGYNTRDNYFIVKYRNYSNKTLTILPSNAQVWDMDYKSFDRNLYLKNNQSINIKPRKSATVKFYVKGKNTWYDYSDFTLVYKFRFDGKTYDGHVWDEESVYRIGKKWYRTYYNRD